MNAAHPTMRQALADCLPPGFRQAPVMHAISIAESAHISRLEAQVAAQAATIVQLRAQIARHLSQITMQSDALRAFEAPPCPADHIECTYKHPEVGELICHCYYEQGEPENGWPPVAELRLAYANGREIGYLLSDADARRIEMAAVAQLQEPA